MKKLTSIIILTFGLVGCCQVERRAVENVEKTQAQILPKYLKYVQNDAALSPEAKDDEKKLVDSLNRLMDALKKQTE